jgi:hypothetical protein
MDFYPSKTNDRLNRRTFRPELVGRVMVNPRYPIRELGRVAPWWCTSCRCPHTFPRVRCDSGAFQDIGRARLFPWQALDAQLRYEEQLRWWTGDQTFHFEALFIYDDPAGVDEAVIDGIKVKVRGTEKSAAAAVESTLDAARYYSTQRKHIRARIGWVGQGIDAAQYMGCVRAMLPYFRRGDIIGLGGFCIWGRMPRRMRDTAHETIARVVNWGRRRGIREYHMLGVMYAPAVQWAAGLARVRRVRFSTDGSAPEQAACIGGRGYEAGRQVDLGYRPADKYERYHPCDLALENIRAYHDWARAL